MSASDVHVNFATVHSDTEFIKLLRFIKLNPGCTRNQILAGVKGPEYARPGYFSDYFAYFIRQDLAKYVRAGSKFYYYTTARGNAVVNRADKNGPQKKKVRHTSRIRNVDIPFNYELPAEKQKIDEMAALLKDMVDAGAVEYDKTYGRSSIPGDTPKDAMTQDQAQALAKKHGGRHGKSLLNRLLEWGYIHHGYKWIRLIEYEDKGLWATPKAIAFLNVWPTLGQAAQDVMKG